jgi:hypothetical protein
VSGVPSATKNPEAHWEHCESVALVQVTGVTQLATDVQNRQGPGLPFRYRPDGQEVQSLAVAPLHVAQEGSQTASTGFAHQRIPPIANMRMNAIVWRP